MRLAYAASANAQPQFSVTHAEQLGGSRSYASAVSNSGVVVGTSSTPGDVGSHAFVFTHERGLLDLGTLGGYYSAATALSDNGRFVVGQSYTQNNAALDAFVWTRERGMIDLGSADAVRARRSRSTTPAWLSVSATCPDPGIIVRSRGRGRKE